MDTSLKRSSEPIPFKSDEVTFIKKSIKEISLIKTNFHHNCHFSIFNSPLIKLFLRGEKTYTEINIYY